MELKDTVEMMLSDDEIVRLSDELEQLDICIENLENSGDDLLPPIKQWFEEQLKLMKKHRSALEKRLGYEK